ncbi:DUF2330 domain-containing protein [Lignipirellula cremea]|uniref:Uncharacterized protein n=1 Tax=Lignipirellula cremea TaxID=2528010 RepID=A0A518DME1_9BACT|nr:DUF2330 domain-containing protein [Lignipirellula cremea]QDU92993.1 hypothetical protein Pla8534_07680 [Lignipirellula cremea]
MPFFQGPSLKAFVLATTAASLLTLPGPSPVDGCLHLHEKMANSSNWRPRQAKQRAVLLHANGREDLILSIDVNLNGSEKPVTELGWVITIPSVPEQYSADVDPKIFDQAQAAHLLAARVQSLREVVPAANNLPRSYSYGGGASGGGYRPKPSIEVQRFDAGPYAIHQIRTVGKNAVEELNQWFKTHHFAPVTADHMQFFIDRQFTFVCVKVVPQKGADALQSQLKLPPLRITFPTDRLYYPLKFSSNQGVFNLQAYAFTDQPIDFKAAATACRQAGIDPARYHADLHWTLSSGFSAFPTSPGTFRFGQGKTAQAIQFRTKHIFRRNSLLKNAAPVQAWLGPGRTDQKWYVNRLDAIGVNGPANPIAKWTDDLFFPLARDGSVPAADDSAAIERVVQQARTARDR